MTGLSIAQIKAQAAAVASGEADEMDGFFAYDIVMESQNGTVRGMIGLALGVIEDLLRDLVVSDPLPPRPEVAALIAPGGPLDGRQALLDHLAANSFIGAATRAAVQALFDTAREHCGYADLAKFDDQTIAALRPYLTYFAADDVLTDPRALAPDSIHDDFVDAFNSLTSTLLDHISNRQRGLE